MPLFGSVQSLSGLSVGNLCAFINDIIQVCFTFSCHPFQVVFLRITSQKTKAALYVTLADKFQDNTSVE